MTGTEQAKYQRIPTDEFEAQTLASAHLDGIKSEAFFSMYRTRGFGVARIVTLLYILLQMFKSFEDQINFEVF